MANHEKKEYAKSVDVLMAFARKKCGQAKAKCIRVVVRNYPQDLKLLEYRVSLLGGEWRIHKTVNKRDTEKARKWLIHKLIDNPEQAGFVDSLWRTALLQPENTYGKKRFLLDVDFKDEPRIAQLEDLILQSGGVVKKKIKTPHGYHFITNPFDARKVCELPEVSLKRDGYYFVKSVGGQDGQWGNSIICSRDNSNGISGVDGKV